MADPFTWAAIIAVAVGTAISVSASIRQGQVAAKTAEFNARQQAAEQESAARAAEREAKQAGILGDQEQQATDFDIATANAQFARRFATRAAFVGASGVEPTGSPLLVAIDEAREAALTTETQQYQSSLRQRDLADQARLSTFQAEELRRQVPVTLGLGRARATAFRQEATLTAAGQAIGGVGKIATIGGDYYRPTQGSRTLISTGGRP